MTEFVETVKNFNRMCEYNSTQNNCIKCGMSTFNNGRLVNCDYFLKNYPQETKKIVTDWVKAHPVITNADKYKETFGFEPDTNHCPMSLYVKTCRGCDDCEYRDFWGQEYQEPKRGKE